jgi:hypothetical protein
MLYYNKVTKRVVSCHYIVHIMYPHFLFFLHTIKIQNLTWKGVHLARVTQRAWVRVIGE